MAHLVHGAVQSGYGYEFAISMSPRQLVSISGMMSDDIRTSMLIDAIAARIAQSDTKSWKAFIAENEK